MQVTLGWSTSASKTVEMYCQQLQGVCYLWDGASVSQRRRAGFETQSQKYRDFISFLRPVAADQVPLSSNRVVRIRQLTRPARPPLASRPLVDNQIFDGLPITKFWKETGGATTLTGQLPKKWHRLFKVLPRSDRQIGPWGIWRPLRGHAKAR